jgi:hypothetical protein
VPHDRIRARGLRDNRFGVVLAVVTMLAALVVVSASTARADLLPTSLPTAIPSVPVTLPSVPVTVPSAVPSVCVPLPAPANVCTPKVVIPTPTPPLLIGGTPTPTSNTNTPTGGTVPPGTTPPLAAAGVPGARPRAAAAAGPTAAAQAGAAVPPAFALLNPAPASLNTRTFGPDSYASLLSLAFKGGLLLDSTHLWPWLAGLQLALLLVICGAMSWTQMAPRRATGKTEK